MLATLGPFFAIVSVRDKLLRMMRDSQDSNMSLPSIPFSSDDRRSQDFYSNSRVIRVRHNYGEDLAYEQSTSNSLDRQQNRYPEPVKGGTTTAAAETSIYQGMKSRFCALFRKVKAFKGKSRTACQ
jgi:hypothetical protein